MPAPLRPDLAACPALAVDYAIRSLTLQATREPRRVLAQMVRIGPHAIVSFLNFGHWRVRLHGSMPAADALPEAWYESPNIHLCTVKDSTALTRVCGNGIEGALVLNDRQHRANLFGEKAVFRLRKT